MKLHFGHKLSDLTFLRKLLLLSLAVVCLVSVQPARAQSVQPYSTGPLIGKLTPKQITEEWISYLRTNIKPTVEDFLPVQVNPDLKLLAGQKYAIADDAPSSPTASLVTSTEQTIDVTLPWYTIDSTYTDATAGLPTNLTPNNTDVTWSYDESFLVFSSNITGYYHLYAISTSGGPLSTANGTPVYVEQLTGNTTDTADYDERYPSLLHPGDNEIAYCSDNNGTNGGSTYHLFIAPFLNSGAAYSVDQTDAQEIAPTFAARHPFYVSGGSSILFSGMSAASDHYDIYEVATDGSSAPQQFTGEANGTGADNDNPVLSDAGYLAWDSNVTNFTASPGSTPSITGSAIGYRSIWAATTNGNVLTQLTSSASYNSEHPEWTTSNENDFAGLNVGEATGTEDLFFDSDRTSAFPPSNTTGGHSIYYYTAWSNLIDTSELTGSSPKDSQTIDVPASFYNDIMTAATAAGIADTKVSFIISEGHANSETFEFSSFNTGTNQLRIPTGTATAYSHSAGETIQIINPVPTSNQYGILLQTEAEANDTVQVNTSDPTHETILTGSGATGTAGVVNDEQVSVAPQLLPPYISVAYISNRYLLDHITDNPLTVNPLSDLDVANAAVSAGATDVEPTSYATNPLYPATGAGEVMISRLLDVDPPSLITYNTTNNEIVHVFPGDLLTSYTSSLAQVTHYVPPGQDATFVVRLSDRQTGVGQAWLQIKDPESSYQSSGGLEHKVFTQQYDPYLHPYINEATTLFGYALSGIAGADPTVANTSDTSLSVEVGNQVSIPGTGTGIQAYPNNDTEYVFAAVMAGSTTIEVVNSADFTVGERVEINPGASDFEVVTVTGVTAGTTTTQASITVTAVVNAHVALEPLYIQSAATAVYSAQGYTSSGPYFITVYGTPYNGQFNVGDIINIYYGATNTYSEDAEITSEKAGPTGANNTPTVILDVDKAPFETPADNINNIPLSASYAAPDYIQKASSTRWDPLGQEVDCQAIDTNIPANSNGADVISQMRSDYYTPEYTPSIDDSGPFPGTPENNASNGTYWLALKPMPSGMQDGNGGTLYYATWNTPLDASDYYIDVIAEDASYNSNWRIYDNIWGFTTHDSLPSASILVVNDYALPQKFYGRGGAGSNIFNSVGASNGPAHIYGTESYWTDINNNIADYQSTTSKYLTTPTLANYEEIPPVVLPLMAQEYADADIVGGGTVYTIFRRAKICFGPYGERSSPYFPAYANGLGVNSYEDAEMRNVSTVGQSPEQTYLPNSQQYAIWRILSRGPVPLATLESYGSKPQNQPANPFSADPTPLVNTVAQGCVIWLSPYSGDTYAGPGTITDSATQTNLTEFLSTGGRLHIEGKDIGYALTEDGDVANAFYDNILNDNYVATAPNVSAFLYDDVGDTTGAYVLTGLTAQADSISRDAYVNNGIAGGGLDDAASIYHENFIFPTDSNGGYAYSYPATHPLIIGNFGPSNADEDDRTDASLDCFSAPFSFIDGFNTNASSELTGSGEPDREVFYRNSTNGSIVSYSSFGIATISQSVENPQLGAKTDNFYAVNQRTNLIHNIICTLRTGTVTGFVTSNSIGLGGATVVATPGANGGYVSTASYTGTTSSNGSFQIEGLLPGIYNLSVYKAGYFAHVNGAAVLVHGGDTTSASLTTTPESPGSLKVTVLTSGGTPISGATVTPIEVESNTGPGSGTTGSTGIVTFNSIESGVYNVTATAPGYSSGSQNGVTISVGMQTSITITLATQTVTTATLSVNLVDSITNDAVSGIPVTVVSGAHSYGPTTTDLSGNATFTGVVPGTYTITPSFTGTNYTAIQSIMPTPVVVTVGNITTEKVVLTAATGSVTGTVTIAPADTSPLANATVVFTSGNYSFTTTTNSNGVYTITGVPTGTYTAQVTLTNYATDTQSNIPITTGQETTQNFSLTYAVHVFPSGLQMFSVPYDYSAFSLAAVLSGTEDDATTPISYNDVAAWAPLADQYNSTLVQPQASPTPDCLTLHIGQGYWARFGQDGGDLLQTGKVESGVELLLEPGWNMIGNPTTAAIPLTALSFYDQNGNGDPSNNNAPYTFTTASESGGVQLISPILYGYSQATNSYYAVSPTNGSGNTALQPYSGYWLYSYGVATLVY